MFRKAEKRKAKLRMALIGPSGSGKTYSALLVAMGLGGPIAMLDTEQGSGELYADLCDYDVARITPPFLPDKYIQAIGQAERAGYNVLIIDSLSHAWAGQGGLLEEVDRRKAGQKNQFAAWRDVTPMHNALVDAMLQSTCHIIATMRSKTAYDMQKDEKGNLKPVKIGLAPVQREGMEYEFTLVMDIENEKHVASPSKDRTRLFDGSYFVPTAETGQALREWLESGSEAPAEPPQPDQPARTSPGPNGKPASQAQVRKIQMLANELQIATREDRLEKINIWLEQRGKDRVQSTKELSGKDASELIDLLQRHVSQQNHLKARERSQPQEAAAAQAE